jgi:hypothetical protein
LRWIDHVLLDEANGPSTAVSDAMRMGIVNNTLTLSVMVLNSVGTFSLDVYVDKSDDGETWTMAAPGSAFMTISTPCSVTDAVMSYVNSAYARVRLTLSGAGTRAIVSVNVNRGKL